MQISPYYPHLLAQNPQEEGPHISTVTMAFISYQPYSLKSTKLYTHKISLKIGKFSESTTYLEI